MTQPAGKFPKPVDPTWDGLQAEYNITIRMTGQGTQVRATYAVTPLLNGVTTGRVLQGDLASVLTPAQVTSLRQVLSALTDEAKAELGIVVPEPPVPGEP